MISISTIYDTPADDQQHAIVKQVSLLFRHIVCIMIRQQLTNCILPAMNSLIVQCQCYGQMLFYNKNYTVYTTYLRSLPSRGVYRPHCSRGKYFYLFLLCTGSLYIMLFYVLLALSGPLVITICRKKKNVQIELIRYYYL